MAGRQESLWIFAMKVNLLMTKKMAPFPFKYWAEFDCHFGRVSMFQTQYGIHCGNPYFCCKNKNVKLSITDNNWSRQWKKRELKFRLLLFGKTSQKINTGALCWVCVIQLSENRNSSKITYRKCNGAERRLDKSFTLLAGKGQFPSWSFPLSPVSSSTWQFSKRKLRLQLTTPMV